MSPEAYARHPFSKSVSSEFDLLWVGRPDENLYMKRAWGGFKKGCVLGSIVEVACIIGAFDPYDRFQEAFCIFMLLIIPLLLWFGLTETRKVYQYAPWYAVTKTHLFFTMWDAGPEVRATEISNIVSVDVKSTSLDRSAEQEVGTVICRCHSAVLVLISKTIRLDLIEQPQHVAALINKLTVDGITAKL